MGTSDRIERERQAKRALILEAARELFLERGYEAVTLRSVAERIEHSTTAVYVHFKDKRDLVDQMVREDFGTFDAALLAKAAVQPAMERLEQLGEAYIEFALRLPRHYQLLFLTPRPDVVLDEAAHAPAPEGGPTEHGARGFMLLLTTVQACIDEGAFEEEHRDALGIAQAVWAAVHGLVSLLIIMGKEAHFQWRAPEVLYQMLMGSMLRGMRRGSREASEAREAREAREAPAAPRPAAAKAAAATARGSGRGKRTGR
jgi:AcrR family transcriptional regulator